MTQHPHFAIEEMIARIALEDRRAFDSLYQATSGRLNAVCLSVLKDKSAAEDVLQEVYLKIWHSADRYAVNGLSPMTWLITIARNRSIDRLRARQRRPLAEPDETAALIASTAPGPEALAIIADERSMLAECLSRLGQAQADALRAVYLEGASYADLAARVGQNLNTVKSWLRRGIVELRNCVSR